MKDKETTHESGLKRHTEKEDWWGTFVALWDIAKNGHVVGSPGKEIHDMEGPVIVYSVYDGIQLMLVNEVSCGYSYSVRKFLDGDDGSNVAYCKPDKEIIKHFQDDASSLFTKFVWCSDIQKFETFKEFYWDEIFVLLVSAEIHGVSNVAHRALAMRDIPEDYQEEFYEELEERL